jgi:FixJ family two-component response regulator
MRWYSLKLTPGGVPWTTQQSMTRCRSHWAERIHYLLVSAKFFYSIVVGQSNKEIARSLGLSEGTVKIHITKLYEKLGVHHRSAVALAGAKLGLRLVPLLRLVA